MNFKRIFSRLLFAVIFGTGFLILTEIGQPSLIVLTGGRDDCCARCSDFLYDNAQPILALSAAVAFFSHFFIGGKILGFRYIAKVIGVCWLSFQIFAVWTAAHLWLRTECTALYSPGPIFIIGVFVVAIVLLVESAIWAGICAVPILLLGLVRKLVAPEEVTAISLKDS